MPFHFEEKTTPAGKPLLVVHATGHIALEDAEALASRVAPGAANHGWLVLTYAAKGVEYAPAARKRFNTMITNYRALAAVVTSAIVRAAINMMLRLSGGAANFRMFSDEKEAMAWLDGF